MADFGISEFKGFTFICLFHPCRLPRIQYISSFRLSESIVLRCRCKCNAESNASINEGKSDTSSNWVCVCVHLCVLACVSVCVYVGVFVRTCVQKLLVPFWMTRRDLISVFLISCLVSLILDTLITQVPNLIFICLSPTRFFFPFPRSPLSVFLSFCHSFIPIFNYTLCENEMLTQSQRVNTVKHY